MALFASSLYVLEVEDEQTAPLDRAGLFGLDWVGLPGSAGSVLFLFLFVISCLTFVLGL